jgi:hypothetical protein
MGDTHETVDHVNQHGADKPGEEEYEQQVAEEFP